MWWGVRVSPSVFYLVMEMMSGHVNVSRRPPLLWGTCVERFIKQLEQFFTLLLPIPLDSVCSLRHSFLLDHAFDLLVILLGLRQQRFHLSSDDL